MRFKAVLFSSLILMIAFTVPVVPAQAQTASEIDSYIELLRSDLKTGKKELITALLDLPADKAPGFWEIYNKYQLDMDKVSDQRVANIKDFGANFEKMTEAKAAELMKSAVDFQTKRIGVHKSYMGKFQKAIGAVETAKLMQLESVIQDLVDLQIHANLPLIEKTAVETSGK
ncbi:MAG TPA: hypothetical protein VFB89_15450 [Gemmatimonadales bacterium]|nr:hypothetical protein [Gemmatimonadales bacterium]